MSLLTAQRDRILVYQGSWKAPNSLLWLLTLSKIEWIAGTQVRELVGMMWYPDFCCGNGLWPCVMNSSWPLDSSTKRREAKKTQATQTRITAFYDSLVMNCEKARGILMHVLGCWCLTKRAAVWGRTVLPFVSCPFIIRKAVSSSLRPCLCAVHEKLRLC